MTQTLICTRCGSSFTQATGRPATRCGPCKAIHKRERARERQAKWKANPENREKARLYLRDWHQARKDDPEYRQRRSDAGLKKRHGLTPAELQALADEQDGRCAICRGGPNGPGKRLHVDHCHTTGRRRLLLCAKCNTGVGLFDDDPERLEAAAAYLRGWQ